MFIDCCSAETTGIIFTDEVQTEYLGMMSQIAMRIFCNFTITCERSSAICTDQQESYIGCMTCIVIGSIEEVITNRYSICSLTVRTPSAGSDSIADKRQGNTDNQQTDSNSSFHCLILLSISFHYESERPASDEPFLNRVYKYQSEC